MILSCNNITKSFDGNTILNNCSFNVDDNEKVAIVGINGAGKSTFFKIITKQLSADNGVVTLAKDKVMSYLSQHPDMNSNRTIYEEMLDAKKDIIETENTLREMESRMSCETGDTLNKTLESYTSLSLLPPLILDLFAEDTLKEIELAWLIEQIQYPGNQNLQRRYLRCK